MTPAVKTTNLTKTYGEGETEVRALRDVSLEIPKGELVVLLGPSGSGKTTLLNQLGALEEPTSGSVEADGITLNELGDKERTAYRLNSIGFVFQFYNLVPTLTAKENVALIAELASSDGLQRTETVLAQVGLADRMDHFPGQLSGGEQQRVSIARGLVKDPPLMLCDEPTGSLDVESGISILNLLRDVTESGERSVLIVTHNAVTANIADRVIRLRDGEIISVDTNASPAEPGQLDW
ncbi:MAG: ABC transporter ATP-binding protein [Acidimicrobiia bacterium]